MKKWLLKQFGRFVDYILPNSTKVKVPDVVTGAVNRAVRGVDEAHADFTHAVEFKLDGAKKIKINTKALENPLADIQHEPLAHTPIHSQQTPLVRAMGRRKSIQQTVKEIEAKFNSQSVYSKSVYPKGGTSI